MDVPKDRYSNDPSEIVIDTTVELDTLGVLIESNKSSAVTFSCDYLRHYEALFAEYRHAAINLIEVGVRGGSSMKLWHWYFSRAQIVGVDIAAYCASYAGDRVAIKIGSQADTTFMTDVCRTYPPTIFIDDGSHQAYHNIVTFETVFPLLAPGGIYVIEDLFFHYGKQQDRYQSDIKRNSPEYLLDLGRDRMARRSIQGNELVPPHLQAMVDSITFINCAAIIRKRRDRRDVDSALAFAEAYRAGHALDAGAHWRLADYVLRHEGPTARAEALCDSAISAAPDAFEPLRVKANLFRRRRDTVRADALAEEAEKKHAVIKASPRRKRRHKRSGPVPPDGTAD